MPSVTEPQLPDWVPEDVIRYLQHTEHGISLRQLAKSANCHPSTVMRQIRKIEERRDDPLIDAAIEQLSGRSADRGGEARSYFSATQDDLGFEQDVERVLTLLSKPGATLIVGEGIEKALLIRKSTGRDNVEPMETQATIELSLVQAIVLCNWIISIRSGLVRQYKITPEGRSFFLSLMARREGAARARSESLSQAGIQELFPTSRGLPVSADSNGRTKRIRYSVQETPLQILARHTDRDGVPFLSEDLVRAGRRLREDFELAQIGHHIEVEQSNFRDENRVPLNSGGRMSREAFERVNAALIKLGPGLSDIAMRCCCHLEGLEAAERELGWSARSGKVVLRIALEHLHAFYDEQSESFGMIG